MKKIIIINEDGSRKEIPDVTAYGLAVVTSETVYKRMELECSTMDGIILAGNIEVIAEEIEDALGVGKDAIEQMKDAVHKVESRKDGENDEDQN